MIRLVYILVFVPCLCFGQGPYAPPAGQPGSTAISKDSSVFTAWATNCDLIRGYFDIATKDSTVTHGSASNATGFPDGSVVSLGDSGVATLSFVDPIHNGPGADFAVFENSFTDDYLELAFVEVSSDGVNFVRFPAISLTSTAVQTGPFGSTDATDLYNLAGKYRGGFGTPFDLSELRDSAIDINNITHVRIVDVIGTIDSSLGSFDSQGNLLNDPYPTIFASGGFDLDAVGVIHSGEVGLNESAHHFKIYPNPAQDFILIKNTQQEYELSLVDITGKEILRKPVTANRPNRIETKELPRGIYFLNLKNATDRFSKRIILK